MKQGIFISIVLMIITQLVTAQSNTDRATAKAKWINTQMQTLSLEEKIGQLFMVRAFSNKGDEHKREILNMIEQYHIGGICFFQGTPDKQANLTNAYQAASKIPLMIAIDAEWGLGMRMKSSTISFPKQMALGAIQDDNLIYEMGKEVARQCKRIGVHVNFAPVIDVNNNAANPVINYRSFGEDPIHVAQKAYHYMKGMQDHGLMACGKHFPGHGDTDVDSHYDLPVINHDIDRMNRVELKPFKLLAQQGIESMMVAHVQLPKLDSRANRPATLSDSIVTGILRDQIGYQGLLFTDAMDMQGVGKHFKDGQAELEALMAGNDIILLPNDIAKAYSTILAQAKKDKSVTDRIDESLRRVLSAKYDKNLHIDQRIYNPDGTTKEVNTLAAEELNDRLIAASLTLAIHDVPMLPIDMTKAKHIATLSIGASQKTVLQKALDGEDKIKHRFVSMDNLKAAKTEIISGLAQYSKVIISLHGLSQKASQRFGMTQELIDVVDQLSQKTKVLVAHLGNPYGLSHYQHVKNVIVGYDDAPAVQRAIAAAIVGDQELNGKLPITASDSYRKGMGVYLPKGKTLSYASPESVGLSSDTLKRIDKIVKEMIRTKAAPGCQILVAKDGKIVWHKAYGYQTYEKKKKVKLDDIYDVASITKILASTISLMHLQDQRKFSPHTAMRKYIAEADSCNKAPLIMEDVLAHHAGLKPWIPFYKKTLMGEGKDMKPNAKYYRQMPSDSFGIKVTERLYLRNDYPDTIWSAILGSGLRDKRDYRYSDLGFYVANHTIHRLTGTWVDAYANKHFYEPLGLRNTGFNPLKWTEKSRIVPTEKDDYFRHETIHGHVHDMGAAMLGGVSGHAGLFSSSYDMAVLMQMLLNEGEYGGRRYLSAKTVNAYTRRFYRSTRRGIGFDLKQLDEDAKINMSEKAHPSTFGHLGFTGTAAFADPENDIIYIMLSNRTYPTMSNNKFGKKNYRPRIQTVIYNAIMDDNKA